MKKNSLLSLALLLALVSGASAAQTTASAEPLALPTYVVETGRYAEAEQSINRSLAALRAQASKPVRVFVELPALKALVVAQGAKVLAAARLAKF
jgi:hypothetical protein